MNTYKVYYTDDSTEPSEIKADSFRFAKGTGWADEVCRFYKTHILHNYWGSEKIERELIGEIKNVRAVTLI